MSTSPFKLALTEEEEALLPRVTLDALAVPGPDAVRENGERAAELTAMLLERKAIPEHRVRYFTDPDYYIGGRGSSRKQLFERNTSGPAMLRHPHFLDYLRYFIYGPNLPQGVMESFRDSVEACGYVTSGDIAPLAKEARTLTRNHGLDSYTAAEEFFKLALELDLSPSQARPIRDSVKKISRR